jgi:chemotaxis protein histidine kinase CheA
MSGENAKLDAILTQVRIDFIETTSERLTVVDDLISELMAGNEEGGSNLIELQRHIHSIKGQGTTFDFPSVTTIAHRLEDYIETAPPLDSERMKDVQVFVDHIRKIIESGVNPSTDQVDGILSGLPVTAVAAPESKQTPIDEVRIMLVMPKGAQRKIIGKELASCGFQVINADTPVDAIRVAIDHPPQIVIASNVMEGMMGEELARVLNIVKATESCRVVIATSTNIKSFDLATLPEGTAVVRKGGKFIEELTDYMELWGYFG